MTDYNATYLGRLANALSQLGNALAGGDPDVSISARIGQMNDANLFWYVCRVIVDFTFYPIDGWGHCRGAFKSDMLEDYTIGQDWRIGIVVMTCLMVLVCVILVWFTWSYFGIKKLRK